MKMRHLAVSLTMSFVLLMVGAPYLVQTAAASDAGQLNLNLATKEEMTIVLHIDQDQAQKIIDGRPYESVADLLGRHIISPPTFYKIFHKVFIKIKERKKPQPHKTETSKGPKEGTTTAQQ